MRLEINTLEVERSANFEECGFGIANTAQAFEILSSNIYKDVPRAIIRELSTNASDSHVANGNPDKPFDVHLPNSLEPWLTIRDYGTGLSPEDVKTVYTKYFESTRNQSDAYTGCLGLGSKTPFAYVDQFTIVSRWNGKLYTYSAFKNESGRPSLALLGEIGTYEVNGLEIRIAIKPGDSQKFIEAAQQVYPFFKVCPNIKGATLQFKDQESIIATPDYTIYRQTSYYGERLQVVMGQVCYHVDYDQFPKLDLAHEARLVLSMPMGSCSFTPGREELRYDKRTIDNVRRAAQAALKHASAEFEQQVNNETCLLYKLSKLSKFSKLVHGLSCNGITEIASQETDKYALTGCILRRGDRLHLDHHVNRFHINDGLDKVMFIEQDLEITQGIKNRIRAYLRTLSRNYEYERVYLAEIKDAVRFAELFGVVTTKLSLLPAVARVTNTNSRTAAKSKPIKLLHQQGHDNLGFEWGNLDANQIIDPADACCVPRDGNWVEWNGDKARPNVVREIATFLGFKHVYGISVKRYDALRAKYGLQDLATVAKDRAEKIVQKLDNYALSQFVYDIDRVNHRFDLKKLTSLSDECDDFVKTQQANIGNMHVCRRVCLTLGIKMPAAINYTEVFYKKYPLLLTIDWYSGKITMDMIIDYISLVEHNGE